MHKTNLSLPCPSISVDDLRVFCSSPSFLPLLWSLTHCGFTSRVSDGFSSAYRALHFAWWLPWLTRPVSLRALITIQQDSSKRGAGVGVFASGASGQPSPETRRSLSSPTATVSRVTHALSFCSGQAGVSGPRDRPLSHRKWEHIFQRAGMLFPWVLFPRPSVLLGEIPSSGLPTSLLCPSEEKARSSIKLGNRHPRQTGIAVSRLAHPGGGLVPAPLAPAHTPRRERCIPGSSRDPISGTERNQNTRSRLPHILHWTKLAKSFSLSLSLCLSVSQKVRPLPHFLLVQSDLTAGVLSR